MMENKDIAFELESEIINTLKTIFDPEIPINIYDLGLIYSVDIDEYNNVEIEMTLTSPNCPMADDLLNEVRSKINKIKSVTRVNIDLVFDPPWSKDLLSEEAMLDLGLL